MTKQRSPETLEIMIEARVARLRADALVAANEHWKATHPEKSAAQRLDEALKRVLARRGRGMEPQ